MFTVAFIVKHYFVACNIYLNTKDKNEFIKKKYYILFKNNLGPINYYKQVQ